MRVTGVRTHDVRARTSRTLAGSDAAHADPGLLRRPTSSSRPTASTRATASRSRSAAATSSAAPPSTRSRITSSDATWTRSPATWPAWWRRLTNRQPAPVARPGEGRDPPRDRGDRQRGVGPVGEAARASRCGSSSCDLSPERVRVAASTSATSPTRSTATKRSTCSARCEPTKAARIDELQRDGYPAYVTSVGWLGYPEDKVRALCRAALADGWTSFKTKVGIDVASDVRRCEVMREELGDDVPLMADANQVWDVERGDRVGVAPRSRSTCAGSRSRRAPTTSSATRRSGAAVAPIGVATGEHCANRVMFKQLLQAEAIDYCQIDACRHRRPERGARRAAAGGEVRRPGVPARRRHRVVRVRPAHLGDRLRRASAATSTDRTTEFADHLHEHFLDPCAIANGRYVVPERRRATRPRCIRSRSSD